MLPHSHAKISGGARWVIIKIQNHFSYPPHFTDHSPLPGSLGEREKEREKEKERDKENGREKENGRYRVQDGMYIQLLYGGRRRGMGKESFVGWMGKKERIKGQGGYFFWQIIIGLGSSNSVGHVWIKMFGYDTVAISRIKGEPMIMEFSKIKKNKPIYIKDDLNRRKLIVFYYFHSRRNERWCYIYIWKKLLVTAIIRVRLEDENIHSAYKSFLRQ